MVIVLKRFCPLLKKVCETIITGQCITAIGLQISLVPLGQPLKKKKEEIPRRSILWMLSGCSVYHPAIWGNKKKRERSSLPTLSLSPVIYFNIMRYDDDKAL